MEHGKGRQAISTALGVWLFKEGKQPEPTPVPIATVDSYIRRAKDMWAEESAVTRGEARKRQIRRLFGMVMQAKAEKRHTDAIRIEALLSKVEGTEPPRKISLSTPPGESLKVQEVPKTAPTSDDLRRELAALLGKSKGGKELAAALSDDEA